MGSHLSCYFHRLPSSDQISLYQVFFSFLHFIHIFFPNSFSPLSILYSVSVIVWLSCLYISLTESLLCMHSVFSMSSESCCSADHYIFNHHIRLAIKVPPSILSPNPTSLPFLPFPVLIPSLPLIPPLQPPSRHSLFHTFASLRISSIAPPFYYPTVARQQSYSNLTTRLCKYSPLSLFPLCLSFYLVTLSVCSFVSLLLSFFLVFLMYCNTMSFLYFFHLPFFSFFLLPFHLVSFPYVLQYALLSVSLLLFLRFLFPFAVLPRLFSLCTLFLLLFLRFHLPLTLFPCLFSLCFARHSASILFHPFVCLLFLTSTSRFT